MTQTLSERKTTILHHSQTALIRQREAKLQRVRTLLAILEDSLPYMQNHELTFLHDQLVCETTVILKVPSDTIITCLENAQK